MIVDYYVDCARFMTWKIAFLRDIQCHPVQAYNFRELEKLWWECKSSRMIYVCRELFMKLNVVSNLVGSEN
jgi:hypothetical protein